VVALAIATQGHVVVLFFMGVKYSTKLTKLTVISCIFTFMALIGMTLADYMSRACGRCKYFHSMRGPPEGVLFHCQIE